jgi:hypothetical protein
VASKTTPNRRIPQPFDENFLLDYLMPTLVGVKTVLEDLATKTLEVREIRPGDLFETRFLLELKESGSVR